jgi:hypothetical protein
MVQILVRLGLLEHSDQDHIVISRKGMTTYMLKHDPKRLPSLGYQLDDESSEAEQEPFRPGF